MDYSTTEAYRRGIAYAEAQLALAETDHMSVSVRRYGEDLGREWFDLCLICGWGRKSGRCPHAPPGVVAQGPTSTAVTDDG